MGVNVSRFKGLILVFGLGFLLFSGCSKDEVQSPANKSTVTGTTKSIDFLNQYEGLDKQTMWELQQATAATARYMNIANALKDGYADINVILQNMGYHYMKASILDATFDYRKPEILVYNKDENGDFYLVAVEYAVPLNLSATAPEGFSGDDDVWSANTGFGLWLLHAWVWEYNPEGVFNPTNPNVIVTELL